MAEAAAARACDGVTCPNQKCMCRECTCGEGCTCNVSPEVTCDPCNIFKAARIAEMSGKVAAVPGGEAPAKLKFGFNPFAGGVERFHPSERPGDAVTFPAPGQVLHVHYTCRVASDEEYVDSSRGEESTTINGEPQRACTICFPIVFSLCFK